jgi:hypothetical protein
MKSVVGVLDCLSNKVKEIIQSAEYVTSPYCFFFFHILNSTSPDYVSFSCRWKFDAPLVNAASRQQSVANTEDGH